MSKTQLTLNFPQMRVKILPTVSFCGWSRSLFTDALFQFLTTTIRPQQFTACFRICRALLIDPCAKTDAESCVTDSRF
jgi:hypothetical protein